MKRRTPPPLFPFPLSVAPPSLNLSHLPPLSSPPYHPPPFLQGYALSESRRIEKRSYFSSTAISNWCAPERTKHLSSIGHILLPSLLTGLN